MAPPKAESDILGQPEPLREIVKSPTGPVYSLAIGDPDSTEVSRSSETRLLDALPEGTDPKKYRYMWVPTSSIPLHTQGMIELKKGRPVDPDNHPNIQKHLFTNNRYDLNGEQVLWYFQKESFDEHYNNQAKRRGAVTMFRQGQGIDPDGQPLPSVIPKGLKK